ncbi:DUF4376 domain-containing protein [Azospirillum sp. INR13]|uniref:DUF4376 domain-containing protein n=1 Tax=Azospirillum sp. INR13 TaxID=2596919 RepID=UPI0018925A71|nr:DUF4376 domain-containing protein [Azospirillum sp. INR13]MBF5094398.1 DUF4376 domain-containing protein [Azospirillum sp. INR13]
MQFPVAVVSEGAVIAVYAAAAPFVYGEAEDAVNHPADAWSLWSADDWAAMCPGWSLLPVVDDPPLEPGKRAEWRPVEDWTVGSDAVTVVYRLVDLSSAELANEAGAARFAKVRAIDAERDRRLGLGALHAGKRFSTSDASRTDLGGMATTAGLVLSGALPAWPDSYAQGWIAIDNTRLPLPTPADGIALAAAVALSYSATVQHARDLKDAALTAADPAAVDELAGWPE